MFYRSNTRVLAFIIAIVNAVQGAAQTNCSDSIHCLNKQANALHFLVIGDWGRNGAPGQQSVACTMSAAAAQLPASFVISTGDNLYPGGAVSATDSQWINSFEKVYSASSLQVKWYPVLGNHDYISNPDAEIAYSKLSQRWYMPARYYPVSYPIGKDSMLLVFIDTDPIEKEFRGIPYDNEKFKAGAVKKQLEWLQTVLSSSHAKWKLVIGHNPLYTGGARRHSSRTKKMRRILEPILKKYKIDAYLCGHDHHLEYLKPKGSTYYIISGAGSQTTHVGWLKYHRRFAARQKGFAALSVTPKEIRVQFINTKGNVLYNTSIIK